MNLRHFENTARKSFWVIHVEAWRQSGLARTTYCRHHRLNRRTFERWLDHLMGKEAARKHAESQAQLLREACPQQRQKGPRRRQRQRFGVSTDVRNRALRAFWAMHVEAMNWSGMGVREYAAALHLSPYALHRWRDRVEDGEVEIDWRAHLHPSARPAVSTSANGTAPESDLTGAAKDVPTPPPQAARRFFSDEEKRAIALESNQPGVSVSAVARKHGIVTGMLFRWRVQFDVAQRKRAKLASVTLPDDMPATLALQRFVQPPDGMMAVDLPDGRRMFAPEGCDPDVVRARIDSGGVSP
ncbi:IS66-like element accessory protein TnpA [Aminobacter aminovorans]|uniref:IS66-like element accessory protein TnpA n=1 Tax=Aminobacter aminovorans TaxID=83263 RepID=UPI002857C916|nr:transposase [Aminobacter aminovorans]MDR7225216.1 transposase-like protein [Aminobacter aminovorans]